MTRPTLHYIALGALFLCAVAYQVRVTEYRFPRWFHRTNAVEWPFHPLSGPDGVSVHFLIGEAKAAGLKEGARLVAVDGRPLTGTAVYGEAIARARSGEVMSFTVRSGGVGQQPEEKTVAVKLTPKSDTGAIAILLFLAMPAFCLLLGFWVPLMRPRDPLAWLVLALMLSFQAVFDPGVETWGPWRRDLGMAYHNALGTAFPLWMLLFGVYFPEPLPPQSWMARWRWVEWVFIVPLGLFSVLNAVVGVGELENLASVRWLETLPGVGTIAAALSYTAVSIFFVCIATKSGMAITPDAKRRLRLLYCGATVSFTPLFLLVIIAQLIKHQPVEEYFPSWVFISAYLLLFLFPITLAYVIVVHRAMDVRVVVRQGLQYAVARGTVRVVRGALSVGLIWASVYLLQHSSTRSPVFYAIIAASAALGFGLRRLGDWLRAWTDRRFFRDAYNAEQILAELSEKVRTIVETRPLLETVAARIADSLHVPRIAVLTDGSGPYRPVYALGYGTLPDVTFPEGAATIRQLCQQKEPARVYFDDPNSWIYRTPGLDEKERAKLAALRAELLLPLAVKDKLLGFISLSQKLSEEPYSGNDLRLLKSVASQTGLALENARLTATVAEAIAEREKLNREVEIAREVQERLFPQKLPAVPGLDYFGKCRPALGVGGDYYDLLALPEGKLGIAIGDVSGKGISAALMMASLQASLRGEAARAPADLAALMSNVNRLVYEATHVNRYATFFYGQYEPATGTLVYVNAGHNPPMLLRKGPGAWQLERLEEGGAVVGLLPEFPYRQASVTLALNDILVAFTDGISEAMNPRDEEWGEERLIEAIKACDGLSARATIDRLMAAADTFAAGAPQHDDMTLVVVHVVPAS